MAKQKTDDALAAVRTALAAAKTLTEAEASLRAQHTAMLAERKVVAGSWASEAECLANLGRLVDEQAARWARDHGVTFVRQLSGYEKSRGPGDTHQITVPPSLPHFGDLHGTLLFSDLCGLQPEAMKARLAQVVRGSGARFGLPAEERAAKLAEIDAAIAALEDQHQSLVSGAAEVNITLPQLDAVRARTEAAALADERARQLAAERASGEFYASAS